MCTHTHKWQLSVQVINFVYSIKELQLQCTTLQDTANKTAAMCTTESAANTWSGILIMLIDHKSFSLCVTRSQWELQLECWLRSLGSMADSEQDQNLAPHLSHHQSASCFYTGNIVSTCYKHNKTCCRLISSWHTMSKKTLHTCTILYNVYQQHG
jgi:hypothetical protein